MEKLKAEAERLGKSSFAFAFYMDRQKEERERGVTISCTTKEFFTDKWHYTIIDAPGHRDFIKNMISGAAQADVALLMVPSDGNFTTAIQKGNHKAGEVQGQTRQHARLINLLGVKQLLIGCQQDGHRHRGPLLQGALRRGRRRDEEHAHQGRLEEGLRREVRARAPHLRLDGRQPHQEVREHGLVEGHGHRPGQDHEFHVDTL